MNKVSTENNVPTIRFKGFSGEWEEEALGDVTNVYDGTHQTPKYTSSGVMFLSVENIKTLKSEKFISIDSFEKEFKVFPKKNDVLMTRIGDVGTANVVESDAPKAYYVTLALLKYKELDPYFLKNSIRANKVRKDIWHRTLHIAFPKKINMNEIAQVMIPKPTEEDEQTKIGNYFQQLDSLIAQHQKKHDKLLNLKKALLEKMFPKQGATVPEIRFKGFNGEWVQRKLLKNFENIIDFRGRTPKKLGLDWSGTGYLALSALNVKNGFIDFNTDANFGDQELYDKWMLGNELHKNQVLFTTEAPMGNVAQIPDNNKYILSQRTIAFEANTKLIEENFLAVMLRAPSLQTKFVSLSSGGTAQGVSQKSLASVDVVIPKDTTEQTEIGNFFKSLDTLVTQHQAQLKKLNNIKQACLEKMFV